MTKLKDFIKIPKQTLFSYLAISIGHLICLYSIIYQIMILFARFEDILLSSIKDLNYDYNYFSTIVNIAIVSLIYMLTDKQLYMAIFEKRNFFDRYIDYWKLPRDRQEIALQISIRWSIIMTINMIFFIGSLFLAPLFPEQTASLFISIIFLMILFVIYITHIIYRDALLRSLANPGLNGKTIVKECLPRFKKNYKKIFKYQLFCLFSYFCIFISFGLSELFFYQYRKYKLVILFNDMV